MQVGLIIAAGLVASLPGGQELPGRALVTLSFAAGVAATILLGVAAWMSGQPGPRLAAAAVGLYTGVTLLLRTVEVDRGGLWTIVGSVAVLGAVVLLATTSRGAPGRRDGLVAAGVLAGVAMSAVVAAVVAVVLPDIRPPAVVVTAVEVVAWVAATVTGALLVAAGVLVRRPVLGRIGLAFLTVGGVHVWWLAAGGAADLAPVVGAFELGAVAMFLVAAVPFLLVTVRSVGHQQDAARARVAEVEAVVAAVAERDHELRNVVAGLSGAAHVLSAGGEGGTPDGRRLLLAAGAELERLQRMLGGRPAPSAPRTPPRRGVSSVRAVLVDLAAVHRAGGLDIRVHVEGTPEAALDPGVLAQVMTNLLVNCRRHAPGARVWVRALLGGSSVRIEVADDGPGLPDELRATVLQRGVRGPGSAGSGLGLAITADLVGRHGGSFVLRSGTLRAGDRRGCTAVLELPLVRRRTAQVVGA